MLAADRRLGWAIQGAWPTVFDGTEVLVADRANSGTVIAASDNFGRVRMFRSPAAQKKMSFNEFRGHSSKVTRVCFSSDDGHLITLGGTDRCIFQWKHESDEAEDEAEEFRNEPDSEDEADLKDGAVLDRDTQLENANEDIVELVVEEEKEGEEGADEFVAVKPWVGSVVPPSAPPKEDPSAPEEGLVLEWVHGYRSHDVRGNVRYLTTGEIVYTAAKLGVVLNKEGGGIQRFFTDHTDDVISLAVHPNGRLVATGQMGSTPRIIIWNTETMESIQTLVGFHKRGVPLLTFSRDGKPRPAHSLPRAAASQPNPTRLRPISTLALIPRATSAYGVFYSSTAC